MLTGFSHSSFTVSDIDRSVNFYVHTLGMKLGRRWERVGAEIEGVTGVVGAHLKMATVLLGDFTLELIQYAAGAGSRLDPTINNVGAAHIAFTVSDLDGFCNELRRKDVRFYGKPTRLNPPGHKAVYIGDPDGVTVELSESAS